MMKYGVVFRMLLAGWMSTVLFACQQPDQGGAEACEVRFELSLETQTRAPQEIDFNAYSVALYVFDAETSLCVQRIGITSNAFTVTGLEKNTAYWGVFLAIPKGQLPALPDVADAYEMATMQYLDGNQTDQEVFRNILNFSTDDEITAYSIVLTRQNGAIQIRMSNADGLIGNVRLEAEGLPVMFFHDGTGGKVLSEGDPVLLSKSETPAVTDNYRISVNLLPMEDLTGKGRLILTYLDGTETTYELKSTSGTIPIYPNQITWLVLRGTGDGGSFEVGFGGDINLDDDEWDGYL